MSYSPIDIKGIEDFVYFNSAIFFADLSCCQSQKFCKIDSTWIIFIQFCQNLVYKFILSCEAQIQEGLFQLGRIDGPTEIAVEDIEGLFDFNDLLSRDGHGDILIGVEFWSLRLFIFSNRFHNNFVYILIYGSYKLNS